MTILELIDLHNELERNLQARKIARQARSQAAKQGQSTEIHNRYKRCMATFGGQG